MRFKMSIMCISAFIIWQIDRQVLLNERDPYKVARAVAEWDFDILILLVIGFVQAQLKLNVIMRLWALVFVHFEVVTRYAQEL